LWPTTEFQSQNQRPGARILRFDETLQPVKACGGGTVRGGGRIRWAGWGGGLADDGKDRRGHRSQGEREFHGGKILLKSISPLKLNEKIPPSDTGKFFRMRIKNQLKNWNA